MQEETVRMAGQGHSRTELGVSLLSRGNLKRTDQQSQEQRGCEEEDQRGDEKQKVEEEYHCWPGWGMGIGMRFSNTTPHSPPESLAFS